MTPTAESHGWKFSKKAFFVVTLVHALVSGSIFIFPTPNEPLEVFAWFWAPLPMAVMSIVDPGPDSGAAYFLFLFLFLWSVAVGCGFGVLIPLIQRFFPRWKFSKVAFFVATFVHALGSVLLFMFDGGQLEIGFWLWNPLPMAILRMLHHPFSSEAAYSIYFSWSVVVGLWFGFCGSLKPRSPDQFRPYEY